MMEALLPFGDPISKTVMRLATQVWDQNPVILLMVLGLVLFGMYAATGPLREHGVEAVWDADGMSEPG